jgi:hypothetical protein
VKNKGEGRKDMEKRGRGGENERGNENRNDVRRFGFIKKE